MNEGSIFLSSFLGVIVGILVLDSVMLIFANGLISVLILGIICFGCLVGLIVKGKNE